MPHGMWDLSSPTRDWNLSPLALEAQSLNHWTAGKSLHICLLICTLFLSSVEREWCEVVGLWQTGEQALCKGSHYLATWHTELAQCGQVFMIFFQEKLANRILMWKPVFKIQWKINKICLSIIQATGLPSKWEKAPQNEKMGRKIQLWGLAWSNCQVDLIRLG